MKLSCSIYIHMYICVVIYICTYITQDIIQSFLQLSANSTKYQLQIEEYLQYIPYNYLQAQRIFASSMLHLFISSRCLCLAATLGWTDRQRESDRERGRERDGQTDAARPAQPPLSIASACSNCMIEKLMGMTVARQEGEGESSIRRGAIGEQG